MRLSIFQTGLLIILARFVLVLKSRIQSLNAALSAAKREASSEKSRAADQAKKEASEKLVALAQQRGEAFAALAQSIENIGPKMEHFRSKLGQIHEQGITLSRFANEPHIGAAVREEAGLTPLERSYIRNLLYHAGFGGGGNEFGLVGEKFMQHAVDVDDLAHRYKAKVIARTSD